MRHPVPSDFDVGSEYVVKAEEEGVYSGAHQASANVNEPQPAEAQLKHFGCSATNNENTFETSPSSKRVAVVNNCIKTVAQNWRAILQEGDALTVNGEEEDTDLIKYIGVINESQ